MKQNLYLFILAALLGLGGTQTWAQSLTTTEIDGTEFYNIGNADDLATFATIVKDGELGANAVLTADIALSSAWGTPIGTPGGAYSGIFDGKGHKITGFEGEFSSDGGGLFGHTNGATIMNFSIDGVLTATAGTGSGVVGYPTSSYIANVHSTLDIFVPVNGVHHVGGVVGSARGGNVISGCTFAGNMSVAAGSTDNFAGVVAYLGGDSVAFCANYGDITFYDVSCTAGGVAGYLNNTTSYVKNCLNMGTLILDEPDAEPKWGGAIVGRLRNHDASRLTGNCWLEGSATGGTKDNTLASAKCFTQDQLPTGEVCYLLNGDQTVIGWYQTLGTDSQPVLDATHARVYMNGHLHCNGDIYEGATFSNEDAGIVKDDHNFVDGFCTYCGLFDETSMKPNADGFYEIANAGQLVWFAAKVNGGEYDAKGILTADIDMTDADISVFPIGGPDATKRFIGTFDGQGHKITGFHLINPSAATNFGMFNTNTGVVLRNFWLDSSCEIEGTEVVGLIGRHDGGGIFEGIGNCANVTGKNNNVAGLIGGTFGNSSDKKEVIIRNCWTACSIVTTNTSASNHVDCGALAGWFNNANVTIEGFWTVAEVLNPKSQGQYVFRNGAGASFKIKNCFSMYGEQSNFPSFTDEQLGSGEMTWKLNGGSFIDPAWRQTIGEDSYPLPFGKGDIVYETANGYESFAPDDDGAFQAFLSTVIDNEEAFTEDLIAYQPLVEQYEEAVKTWEDIENYEDFVTAYKAAAELKESILKSAASYESYMTACKTATDYIQENNLEGPWTDLLKTYLEEMLEPNNDYPNGSAPFIIESRNMDDEALAAEIAFVNQMLENAIAGGITGGTEITRLMTNSNFADGFEGWTTVEEGAAVATGGVSELMTIARGKGSGKFCIEQTLTDTPNGFYMMTAHGMFRAGSDDNAIYNQFYAGQLYLNGTSNYFMSPGEDAIPASEAEPGVNCLGEDGDALYSMDGEDGYVPKSFNGCSYAYSAGRYQNFCATEVTDGTLTVGVRSLGTDLDTDDWMPFGGVRVYFLGTAEEANEKLGNVLEGFAARAQVIVDFLASEDPSDFKQYPNISEDLKSRLSGAIAAISDAATGGEKMELINTFSSLFDEVHACRKAYIAMLGAAYTLFDFLDVLLESGTITEDEYTEWSDAIYAAQSNYTNGDVTTEEALAIAEKLNLVDRLMPRVDDVYQLATATQLRLFTITVNNGKSNAKAVLTDDIDMSEIADIAPIGSNEKPFQGEFDGQNHKVTGFTMEHASGDKQGFFGYIKNAQIKNFSISGSINFYGGAGVGTIGWSEGSTISNVHSSVDIAVTAKSTHIGGVCGDMRSGSKAYNCSYSGTLTETAGSHDCIGGIGGYSNENCYYENCANYGTVEFAASGAYAGGICGYVNNDNFIGIKNCINVGSVRMGDGTTPSYGGAFVGRLRSHGNSKFENNYMLEGSAARAYGENTEAAETVNAEQLASGEVCYKLNGDQAELNWYQTLGEDSYPVLFDSHKVVYMVADGAYSNEKDTTPDGSKENPFVVKSAADLSNLINLLVSGRMNYVVMEEDVDMAGVTDWTPLFNIPNQPNGYPFIDFDGQGHVIKNLTSKTEGAYDYCGLFGVLCGNVRNLGVENADIACAGGTGILAGYLGHSTYNQPCYVENVWVTGKVTANGYCGGMFGNVANESHIYNCYANVEVTGSGDLTGGIIGRVRALVDMVQVYAAGSINRGGGIIGGGQQDATPLGTYKHVAVWNNTERNFGPVRENEDLRMIIYYDGTNFADMQSQVVAWDPEVWFCDMEPGSYPVLKAFAGSKGDLNGDGKVDIADAVTVLNIMAAGVYSSAADINEDQKVDIADFVSILNIMAAQ